MQDTGLPLACAWCKSIVRDGSGPVSHGICGECAGLFSSQIDMVAREARRSRRSLRGRSGVQLLLPFSPFPSASPLVPAG